MDAINKNATTITIPTGLSSLFLLASTTPTTTNRQFQFVDYGESFSSPDGKPTISCDGRIPGGVTLELTHWTGNETPDELYADTSTEMALKLAQHKQFSDQLAEAIVLNNHYDTDGILSVWACLEPSLALEYSDLLIQGAEAGDFGEWSTDAGVKLDCALSEMCVGDEESAFYAALKELPSMLQDFKTTGGKAYEDLWKPEFEYAAKSWEALQTGDVALKAFNDDIAVLQEASSTSISPYALHRGLKQKKIHHKVKRILRATTTTDKLSSFKYEKVGHGWIQKVLERQPVPSVDANQLVENLNSIEKTNCWKSGGSGLIGICYTTKKIAKTPEEVAEAMARYDDGLN